MLEKDELIQTQAKQISELQHIIAENNKIIYQIFSSPQNVSASRTYSMHHTVSEQTKKNLGHAL